MKYNGDDDFMCIRIDSGNTITTFKSVTVLASKRKNSVERNDKGTAKSKSLWRRLLGC